MNFLYLISIFVVGLIKTPMQQREIIDSIQVANQTDPEMGSYEHECW